MGTVIQVICFKQNFLEKHLKRGNTTGCKEIIESNLHKKKKGNEYTRDKAENTNVMEYECEWYSISDKRQKG